MHIYHIWNSKYLPTLNNFYEIGILKFRGKKVLQFWSQDGDDDAAAGHDQKGNYLVYLGYRREDNSCPDGYVLDIYGYCRCNSWKHLRHLQLVVNNKAIEFTTWLKITLGCTDKLSNQGMEYFSKIFRPARQQK